MKKPILIISLCTILLSVVSCKKDPKSDTVVDTTVETVMPDSIREAVLEEVEKEKMEAKNKKSIIENKKAITEKKKSTEGKSTMRIPGTFDSTDNTDTQKYIKDYEKYVEDYKKAVEAKDMDSFLKLNDASSSLSKQFNRLMNILPSEEIQKVSEYMQVKSEQLAKLSAKM